MKHLLFPISFAIVCAISFAAPMASASDHLDAPSLTGDGQADIADLYAFRPNANSSNSVLILTTVDSSSFGTDVTYSFRVDNNGDALADLNYSANFIDTPTGQNVTLARNGVPIASGPTGMSIATSNGGTFNAGVFDDPFFFDPGVLSADGPSGIDAFAGNNVSALVFELPSSDFESANGNIGVYGTTDRNMTQIDRVGRPAINTVLINTDPLKEDFNAATPNGDLAAFGDVVNGVITSLSDQANADALTPILLPDVLTFDTNSTAPFLNGRRLDDDVIDGALGLLTDGGLTTDLVDANDAQFSSVFPFLAQPAPSVPEPSGLLPTIVLLGGLLARRRRKRV